jgi:hypothetical protein
MCKPYPGTCGMKYTAAVISRLNLQLVQEEGMDVIRDTP